jgi:hypothetical protein
MKKIADLQLEHPLLHQKEACAEFGVAASTYSKWKNKYATKWHVQVEEAARGAKGSIQRSKSFGSGRSAKYPLLEERLYQACVERRESGDKVGNIHVCVLWACHGDNYGLRVKLHSCIHSYVHFESHGLRLVRCYG